MSAFAGSRVVVTAIRCQECGGEHALPAGTQEGDVLEIASTGERFVIPFECSLQEARDLAVNGWCACGGQLLFATEPVTPGCAHE